MPTIYGIHHVSLIVADTAIALEFYAGVLGLKVLETRPALGFAGAWLAVGNQQIHLLELPNPDPIAGRPTHGGRDRHLALRVSSVRDLIVRLDAAQCAYTLSRSGRQALFCRDPDGNALEFIEEKKPATPPA
ncbi:glyoxalase [Chromatium weissei]|nr:glyoxalase [Chromatium weissei]